MTAKRVPFTTTYGDLLGRINILRNPEVAPEGVELIYDRALPGQIMLVIRRFVREASEQLKDFESARDTIFKDAGWDPASGEDPPAGVEERFNDLVNQEVTFEVTALPEEEFMDAGLTLRELDLLNPLIYTAPPQQEE